MPETDVEIDAREGGHFTFIMHAGDEKIPHTGKYLEIHRPDKLVFTWASQYSVVDNSTVTLKFAKIDDNKTNNQRRSRKPAEAKPSMCPSPSTSTRAHPSIIETTKTICPSCKPPMISN